MLCLQEKSHSPDARLLLGLSLCLLHTHLDDSPVSSVCREPLCTLIVPHTLPNHAICVGPGPPRLDLASLPYWQALRQQLRMCHLLHTLHQYGDVGNTGRIKRKCVYLGCGMLATLEALAGGML